MKRFKRLYVYMLKCADGFYYVGVTNEPNRRLEEHSIGLNKNCFTYKRRPVELVYFDYFTDFNQAFEWETQLKKWSRKKKEALISQNWDKIHELAKCQNLTHYLNKKLAKDN